MTANIRSLIERALREAQEEFAAIVQRKLDELMGDVPAPEPATRKRKVAAPTSAVPTKAPRGARVRVPRDHMSALREQILGGMRAGEAMKKSQIIAASGLSEAEAQRVGLILKRLKEEGVLSMRGQKGAATYTLKAGRRRDEPDAEGEAG